MQRALFIAAALVVAACGQVTTATTTTAASATTTASMTTPTDPDAASGSAAQTDAKPPLDLSNKPMAPVAAQFGAQTLIGRWGDNGDCSKSLVQFNADGTFHSFDTNADGRWTLNGDHLTMQGAGGTFELGLHWTDANHMDVLNSDGSMGHSQRC